MKTPAAKRARWMAPMVVALWTMGVCGQGESRAAVPQLLHYQGRVTLEGVNFTGDGHFKFALVDGTGTASYWSNDGTSVGGSEPAAAVTLAVEHGLYAVLLGDAALPNMQPIGPGIFAHEDVRLRVWFGDGTNALERLEPDQRVAAVGYALMAADVADGAVTAAKLAPGAVTPEKLAPGAVLQHLQQAGQSPVVSGGMILSESAASESLAAAGYARAGTVDFDLEEWGRLPRNFPPVPGNSGSAVWTGTEVLLWADVRASTVSGSFQSAGHRFNPQTRVWRRMSGEGAPPYSSDSHTVVWTGKELIVWGPGSNAAIDSARYDPLTDRWRPVTLEGAPVRRSGHTALWTGREMIVWGGTRSLGSGGSESLGDGGRYDPSEDRWTPIANAGAPAARTGHTAVWTGSEMVVWGGEVRTTNGAGTGAVLTSGGRYDPATDRWHPLSEVNVPAGRHSQAAVWTGKEMVVVGGRNLTGQLTLDYGSYDPTRDLWQRRDGVPVAQRSQGAVVWTGSQVLVWGGASVPGAPVGGILDPTSGQWSSLTSVAAPTSTPRPAFAWTGSALFVWGAGAVVSSDYGGLYTATNATWIRFPAIGSALGSGRYNASMVWTGTELLVWGGVSGQTALNTGFRYHPVTDSVTAIPASPLRGRHRHTATWTGKEMFVWGGTMATGSTGAPLNDGARYDPATGQWQMLSTRDAPAARYDHTAIWTGTEMMVWGGQGLLASLDSGARYVVASNLWIPLPTSSAPDPRGGHTTVWTGNEMVVWGGYNATNRAMALPPALNTGGVFDPTQNAWVRPTPLAGAPSPRAFHRAVWTGSEMIVWGGRTNGAITTTGAGNYRNLVQGARYRPDANTWAPMSSVGVPNYRTGAEGTSAVPAIGVPAACWTGSELVVWGAPLSSAAESNPSTTVVYDPTADRWRTALSGGPSPVGVGFGAVWAGNGLLVYGGASGPTYDPAIHFYSQRKQLHLYLRP